MSSSPLRVWPALIGTQVFLHASMAGLRMAVPLWVLRSGEGKALVGPVLSILAAGSVAMALPAGRMTDRLGYHAPVRLAVALTSLGAALAVLAMYAETTPYAMLCLAMFVSGAGSNAGLIAIQRSAGRGARNAVELKRVFAWMGMAPSFSNFVGPLLAGVLIDTFGFRVAFAALALTPLCALPCAALVPRESTGVAESAPAYRAAWDLLRGTPFRRLLLINWFMSASWEVHSFVVPVLGHERGLSASAVGSVLGTFALAVTSVRFLIPLLAHRLSEEKVLRGALIVVAAALFVYPWTRGAFSMMACAVILGLALGSSQPMVMATLHRITPAARHGQAIALRSVAMNLSSALMPLGFAGAGVALGSSGLFWLMSALVASGTFVARAFAADEASFAAQDGR